jgi:hypothetical protein
MVSAACSPTAGSGQFLAAYTGPREAVPPARSKNLKPPGKVSICALLPPLRWTLAEAVGLKARPWQRGSEQGLPWPMPQMDSRGWRGTAYICARLNPVLLQLDIEPDFAHLHASPNSAGRTCCLPVFCAQSLGTWERTAIARDWLLPCETTCVWTSSQILAVPQEISELPLPEV